MKLGRQFVLSKRFILTLNLLLVMTLPLHFLLCKLNYCTARLIEACMGWYGVCVVVASMLFYLQTHHLFWAIFSAVTLVIHNLLMPG